MIASLIAAFVCAAPATFELEPVGNVWVYSHASDPAGDTYLRVWGAEGKSMAANPAEAEDYSYSFLRFDISGLPKDAKLKEAKLMLTHIASPGYTLDYAKANPLDVRALSAEFTEKAWNYDQVASVHPVPGADGLLGWISPEKFPADGEEMKFAVDLAKTSVFSKTLAQAMESQSLCLSLTSSMESSAMQGKSIYKVFSRYADKAKRPILHLVFE